MQTSLLERTEFLADKFWVLYLVGPPGPPPRMGLEWKEETHRWIRPDTGEEEPLRGLSEYHVGDLVQWRTKSGREMTGEIMGVRPRSGKLSIKFPSGKTWALDHRLVVPIDDDSVTSEIAQEEVSEEVQVEEEQLNEAEAAQVYPTEPTDLVKSFGLRDRWRDRAEEQRQRFTGEQAWARMPEDVEGYLSEVLSGADYRQMVEDTLNNSGVYMAIKASNFKKVLKDQRFKNSMETGKGTFKTVGQARYDQIERPIFGVDASDVVSMPKYGFIANKDAMDYEKIVGWGYGDVFVKFKPSVRAQTTVTAGDSFDGNVHGTFMTAPTSLVDVDHEALLTPLLVQGSMYFEKMENRQQRAQLWLDDPTDYKDLIRSTVNAGTYMEAQIFGELWLEDVESIEVQSAKLQAQLDRALKKGGFDIEVKGGMYDDRLKAIMHWDYDKNYTFGDEDLARLGDAYIEAIFQNHRGWLSAQTGKDGSEEVRKLLEPMQRMYVPRKTNYLSAVEKLAEKPDRVDRFGTDVWKTSNIWARHLDEVKTAIETTEDWRTVLGERFTKLGEEAEERRKQTGELTHEPLAYDHAVRRLVSVAQDDRTAQMGPEIKRDTVKRIMRVKAMQAASGLEKHWWDNFKPNQVGWTADVLNQDLLERWPGD